MALWDEVEARYKEAVLRTLTNKDNPTLGTIDTVQGTRAANAAIVDFEKHAQETYDETKPLHVETAVRGTIAFLFEWGGSAVGISRIKHGEWVEECASIRKTGNRGRVRPRSTSGLSVTQDKSGDTSAFDNARLRNFIPGNSRRRDDSG